MAAQTIECPTACSVTLQLEPAPVTAEKLGDISLAFGAMLLIVILVWGGRQLYNVFNGGPHDGG
jgi:hypothetical protein